MIGVRQIHSHVMVVANINCEHIYFASVLFESAGGDRAETEDHLLIATEAKNFWLIS